MSFYQTLREGIQHFVYKVIDPGVRAAVKLGITPNVVTTIGMLGNAAGAGVLVYAALNGEAGDYTYIGWAGVIIILSSIMDMVDGYMARTANMCSTFGAFYDSVLDRYCELLTLSGLAFYLMQTDKPGSAHLFRKYRKHLSAARHHHLRHQSSYGFRIYAVPA